MTQVEVPITLTMSPSRMPAPIASQCASSAPDRNRNARSQAELVRPTPDRARPRWRRTSRTRPRVDPANAGQQRIRARRRTLRWEDRRATRSTAICDPSHRRCGATRSDRVMPHSDGRHEVAVLERPCQAAIAFGIVPQPVPAAWPSRTPKNTCRRTTRAPPGPRAGPAVVISAASRHAAMVAPQVIVVERLQIFVHRNDRRARRVDGQRLDLAAVDCPPTRSPVRPRRLKRPQMIRMTLGRVIGIVVAAVQRDTSRLPEPSRPRSLSKIEKRTLCVPKSTPATIVMRPPSPRSLRAASGTAPARR